MTKQFDWLCCRTETANLATGIFFLFLSPCILGAKQATSCYPGWNKYSFWRIGNQNCCLFSDWLIQGSRTSFIFSRRRRLLTDCTVQFDRLTPGGRQPLDSSDRPEADGSSSTCFNTAKVLPSSWVCTLCYMSEEYCWGDGNHWATPLCSAPNLPHNLLPHGCSMASATDRCSKWTVAWDVSNPLIRLHGLPALTMQRPRWGHQMQGPAFRPRGLPVQETAMKSARFITFQSQELHAAVILKPDSRALYNPPNLTDRQQLFALPSQR